MNLKVEMAEYAALVRKNNPDWSEWEIKEDAVEEMCHRHGRSIADEALAVSDTLEVA